jgi:hypothetical protein
MTAKKKVIFATILLAVAGVSQAGVAPTFTKSYSPATINVGQTSTVTYRLEDLSGVTFTNLSFSDALNPGSLAVAAVPAVTTTCVGASVTAVPGTGLTVSDISVGPFSYCSVSVDVTASAAGDFDADTSDVHDGVSPVAGPAKAILKVLAAAPAAAASIPTLSEWALILMVLALGGSAFNALRRQRR